MSKYTLTALLILVSTSFAQEPLSPAPAPNPAAPFVQALKTAEAKGFLATGELIRRQPEMAGSGQVIVASPGDGAAERFTGRFEAWRSPEGEIVAASAAALPGVVIYKRNDRLVARTTIEDQDLQAAGFADELVRVLDLARVAAALGGEGVEVKTGAEGAQTASLKLPRRFWPASRAGIAFLEKKLLGIDCTIDLDAQGALQAIKITATHSDPMAGIRSKALESAGQGGTIVMETEKIEETEGPDEEGEATIYEIRFSGGKPGPRLEAALAEMRKAVDAAK